MNPIFHPYIVIAISSLLAGVFGHLPLYYLMKYYRKKLYDNSYFPKAKVEEEMGQRNPLDKTRRLPALLGILERIVYAGGYLTGHPEIIAVILALKIAPSLREPSNGKIKGLGWAVFNMYFIGNLLSLILAIAIAVAIKLFFKFEVLW